jgi:hypothetical protein
VVVAQERFSAIRALVAIVLAFGTRWLLLRVYFAVYTPAMSRVGRTAQYVTVLGCVLFVAATVVALVALRSSPTFGWALVTAFVMLALPLALGFLIEGLSYPKDAAVIAAGAVFVAFLGTALSFAGTWVGTLVSRLVPGANRAVEA